MVVITVIVIVMVIIGIGQMAGHSLCVLGIVLSPGSVFVI